MRRCALSAAAASLLLMSLLSAEAQGTEIEATTIAVASPAGVAYDTKGNLYVALQNNHMVVMVDTHGLITTVAGTGEQGFAGDGGPPASAILDSPSGVTLDSAGNIYISDTHNHRIREVSNGIITTIAGTGAAGFSGEGAPPASAQLNHPTAITFDASGNLFIADSDNHRIRRIAGGLITTVAGDGEQTFSGDGGPATSAGLDTPNGVALDPAVPGLFYIADTHNQRIRAVDASGIITTLAGTGVKGFGGDGSLPTQAFLDRPRGLAVDTTRTLYLADSDNNRVRAILGKTIATVAGNGGQGFAGDSNSASAATLDTPTALALGGNGLLSLSDTHNQRARSIQSNAINTVLGLPPLLSEGMPGLPPAQSEGIVLSGAISNTYGSGSLTALFANGSKSAAGVASLLDSGVPVSSVRFANNQANFDLGGIEAGLHTFVVAYADASDTQNAPIASGVFLVTIAQAAQTINFLQPTTPVIYGPGASVTLDATSSSGLPVTYTVTGPATVSGSTLTFTGSGTVLVTAQSSSTNYVTASVSRTIIVSALSLNSLAPATGILGDPAKTLTVTGSAFATNSIILINGVAAPTTFVSSTTLLTTLPASNFAAVQTLQVSVLNPTQTQTSAALPFIVTAPPVSIAVSAPATSDPGTQPQLALTLAAPYPVPVAATLTLSFSPGASGVDDPAVLFSNGKKIMTLDLPAGETTVPPVQIQTGTVSGTIQIVLTLSAGGIDVTPANLTPAIITVPMTAPTIRSVTLARNGRTLTVTSTGYSDTRQVTQAVFQFTPATGAQLSTKDLTIDITNAFEAWYTQQASNAYGSTFTYTQTFNLDDDASVVGQVTLTLTNSSGTSTPASTP